MTTLRSERFETQRARWPAHGRHILAQFDDETVVVYQAFKPEIARFVVEHGYFGGPFSLARMSWVKPNFLWMMYRCGWATKVDQEHVVAVWLRRSAFDAILAAAVPSTFDSCRYADREAWQLAVKQSDVRLQWDPDHGPSGAPLERRAIQLGLRGDVLASYAGSASGRNWIVRVEDITPFVHEQDRIRRAYGELVTPAEAVYPCTTETAVQLGLDDPGAQSSQ